MMTYTTEDGLTKIETSFAGKQPTLKEATVAKNNLSKKELRAMGQLVSGYLDFAERHKNAGTENRKCSVRYQLNSFSGSFISLFSPERT